MTENAKNSSAQDIVQDPPEYSAENTTNPKQSSGWQEKAGRMGTGNIAVEPTESGAYQQNGQSTVIQKDWNSGHPGGTLNSNDNGIDRSIDSEDANRVKGIGLNDDAHVASGGIGGIHTSRIDPGNQSEGVRNAENTMGPGEDYGQTKGGSDWLGGPQNGEETPNEAEKTLQEKPSSDISGPTGSGKVASSSYAVPSVMTENAKNPRTGSDWLGGPQNGEEIPGNGGNGGNG